MSHQPLLPAWVDRLFGRFNAVFGVQKVGAMFPPETHAEVRGLWAEQLGRFEPETLRAALQAVIDAGREWPPTLSEFVGFCQRAAVERRQHAPAVLLESPRASPEVVQRSVEEVAATLVSQKPSRDWAVRIVERKAAGEHVPYAVLRIARNALEA